MRTEDYISRTAFFAKYRTVSPNLYRKFCDQITTSLLPSLDKGISVESIGFQSRWKDSGGNIHCSLNGRVLRLDEYGEIHGEIVLLRRSNTFRGQAMHGLKAIDDWEYIQQARVEFKQGHYSQCLTFLSLLKDRVNLRPSVLRMEAIASKRTPNKCRECSK